MEAVSNSRRDWDFDKEGALEGAHYLGTRKVFVKNGPSAGKEKLVCDFHYGLEDELVSVWLSTVLRSKFMAELRARGKGDFEAGERMTITPLGRKKSASSGFEYPDFDVWFEHAAPKKSTAELLAEDENDAPDEDDDVVFAA